MGIGDVGDSLIEEYRKNNFYFGIKYNLNAHSQYLDVLLGFGIIGFVVFFLAMILIPLIHAVKTKNHLLIFFLVSMTAYMATEVMLNRNQGVTFVAFFIILLAQADAFGEDVIYSGDM